MTKSEYMKKYYQEHQEERKAYACRNRQIDKMAKRRYQQEYRKRNAAKMREYNREYMRRYRLRQSLKTDGR